MAKINASVKQSLIHTAEGARAKRINPELQLRRLVMACVLWEDNFYCDGQSVTELIAETIPKVKPGLVHEIAVEAREKMKLRHAPLLLCREMARYAGHKLCLAQTIERVIQRPDELAELLAIYWKDGKHPIPAQIKKGLALAFRKFSEYQLAKYNRDEAIKLRDVLFLCHAKPKDTEQAALWKRLVDNQLAVPDTWETAISATKGAGKKEEWERLLRDNKLGALALLRNLRNMKEATVDEHLIFEALDKLNPERVLPFRFIAAARHAPQWEPQIELAMLKCLGVQEKLPGHTVLLIDVSGSMEDMISGKSEISRMDAACAVAILLREICERVHVFTFSKEFKQIPPRRGFALRDAIVSSQEHNATFLGLATQAIYHVGLLGLKKTIGYHSFDLAFSGAGLVPDRLIVITDEQSHDSVPDPRGRAYMINVASEKNGVGYGAWHHIDGWSEAVIDYIREHERMEKSIIS